MRWLRKFHIFVPCQHRRLRIALAACAQLCAALLPAQGLIFEIAGIDTVDAEGNKVIVISTLLLA